MRAPILVVALGACSLAAAAELAPAPLRASLETAYARGDRDGLGRAADRLGAGGLGRLVQHGTRGERLAAVAAAPLAAEAWLLGEPLLALAGAHDRSLAAPAARALAQLARHEAELDTPRGEVGELAALASGCAALASRVALRADVRVHALECAVDLAAALGDLAPARALDLPTALLADADPEVRRAAAAHADPDVARDGLVRAALDEAPEQAAAAATAAATLCRAGVALDAVATRAESLVKDADPGERAVLAACP